jgi:hypothetical protein
MGMTRLWLWRGLVCALVTTGCVEVHFTWVTAPTGYDMKEVEPAVGLAVEGLDYTAKVDPPSSGTTWGLRGLLVPFMPIPTSSMQSGTILVPSDGCTVAMHLRKKTDEARLTPASLRLVVGDQSYAPSRARVDGVAVADLAAPVAIADRMLIVFDFDDPGGAPGESFSLVMPGLPEMPFTPKEFTEWSVGF